MRLEVCSGLVDVVDIASDVIAADITVLGQHGLLDE
jgi:hypothetical protein